MGINKTLASRLNEDPEFAASQFPTMSNTEAITIAAIIEQQPGDRDNPSWINGEFRARVSGVQQRQGNKGPFFTATLTDEETGISIDATFFGRKIFPYEGALCHFSGGAMKRDEYQGQPKLVSGSTKTTINKLEVARVGKLQLDGGGAPPPAPQGRQGTAFLGVTVGAALNNAALDARVLNFDTLNLDDSDAVGKWVWRRASVYLRVAAALEAGNLHGKPTNPPARGTTEAQPESPPPPARAPAAERSRPAPGPDGQAFPSDAADEGDSVLF